MTSSDREVGDDDLHPNGMAIIPISPPQREAIELENADNVAKIYDRKRKSSLVAQIDSMAEQEKLAKRIILSLMKPSYVLGLHPNKSRSQHQAMLQKLLHKLVNQQNWVEASGVLSVYLQATVKEMSPFANQFKFLVFLRLLKYVENGNFDSRRITNIYDVWMWKNGSIKDKPIESRYAVDLDFILFFLMQGNIEKAYEAVRCFKQESVFDYDPITNMLMGLVFYEFWYSSCIPEEFQWRDSDQFVFKDNKVSTDADTNQDINLIEIDGNHQRGTAVPNFQLPRFYLDSDSEELSENEDYGLNNRFYVSDSSLQYALEGLDSWLLPLHIPDRNSYENFIRMDNKLFNDNYRDAVRCLQVALDSSPSNLAAFLPLIQLLLIGGQVVQALDIVEKQCCNSASTLPLRVKAILLEQLNPNNYLLLASCLEDILKKDPTCCESLAKLVKMHQDGKYGVEPLIEMIASHLDVANAEHETWNLFASFFKDVNRRHNSTFISSTPEVFIKKSWRVRCRWWLNLHFSPKILKAEIEDGDLHLLTYKAACASYMYGKEFRYVVGAYSHLEKNDHDLFMYLDEHRQNSFGFYK